jgi:hypothetical protein
MDGRQVFRHAVEGMVTACQEVLAQAGKTVADVDLIIPHQANLRISEALRERLQLSQAKVFNNRRSAADAGIRRRVYLGRRSLALLTSSPTCRASLPFRCCASAHRTRSLLWGVPLPL